jgi:hypothetical protein
MPRDGRVERIPRPTGEAPEAVHLGERCHEKIVRYIHRTISRYGGSSYCPRTGRCNSTAARSNQMDRLTARCYVWRDMEMLVGPLDKPVHYTLRVHLEKGGMVTPIRTQMHAM